MAKNTSTTAETITAEANNPDTPASSVVVSPSGETSTPWGTILNKWTTTGVNSAWVTTDNIWPDWKPWDHTKDEAIASWITTDDTWTKSTAQDILDKNAQLETDLEINKIVATSDLDEQKKTDEARIEKNAKDTEALIKEQELNAKVRDEKRKDKIEGREDQDIERLTKAQDLAVWLAEQDRKKLEVIAEQERIKNEALIVEAKKNVLIQQQQSAWAYQKLGLWFSSGIINQSQQIATDWITAVLWIEAQMSLNRQLTWIESAKIWLNIANIKLEYDGLIQDTINTYSDKIDDIDTAAEKRIDDVNKNLLLNSQQKEAAVDWVLKEYRENKTNLERQHIDDMIKIQDRWFKYQKEVEAQIEKEEIKKKTSLTQKILNWTTAWMSDIEQEALETEAWLPRGTIKQKTNSEVMKWIRWMVDSMIGKDVTVDYMNNLVMKANEQMEQWKTLEEAIDIVWSDYVRNNEQYKLQQSQKAEADRLKLQSARASLAAANRANQPKATGSTGGKWGDEKSFSDLQSEFQWLFNKSVPKDMDANAMATAIDNKRQELFKTDLTKWILSGPSEIRFQKLIWTESDPTLIASKLKWLWANDDAVKNLLTSQWLVSTEYSDELAEWEYYLEDNKVKLVERWFLSWWDDTILDFNKK